METKHPKHELVRDSSQLSLVVCIWDCVLIRAFLPSCSYLQTLSSPLFFKFMVSFCLDCCCMHICIFTYIYIPKYNLLSSYNITFYVFKADYLLYGHWRFMTIDLTVENAFILSLIIFKYWVASILFESPNSESFMRLKVINGEPLKNQKQNYIFPR